jgi:hypothetical protein
LSRNSSKTSFLCQIFLAGASHSSIAHHSFASLWLFLLHNAFLMVSRVRDQRIEGTLNIDCSLVLSSTLIKLPYHVLLHPYPHCSPSPWMISIHLLLVAVGAGVSKASSSSLISSSICSCLLLAGAAARAPAAREERLLVFACDAGV